MATRLLCLHADGYVLVASVRVIAGAPGHHPRDSVEMEGGTTFHFVTDGIESALEQAGDAAGGKDVMLWGGAQAANQYLAAGLLNELELHVVPVLLGDGARLFDNLEAVEVQLEQVRAVEAPGVTHLKYTVVT